MTEINLIVFKCNFTLSLTNFFQIIIDNEYGD